MTDFSHWSASEIMRRFWQRIDGASKTAFVTALILGLVTHLYFFVNKFPNGDDLENIYRDYAMTASGRWFDQVATAFSSYYSVPWTTGITALFFLALSVGVLCSLFHFPSRLYGALIAAVMVTFPLLASQFSYLFYADLYMLAQLFSILAVWCTVHFRWGFLLGAVLLSLTLGSYQAFISVTVVVCLLVLIHYILQNHYLLGNIFSLTLKMLLMGILGVMLYFVILQMALHYGNITLTDYQGINTMGQLPEESLIQLLKAAFLAFGAYFWEGTFFESPFLAKICYGVLTLLTIYWLIKIIVRRLKNRACCGQLIMLIPFCLALPIGYNLIFFIAPQAYLHCLMQPAYHLFWVMPIIIFSVAYPHAELLTLEQLIGHWALVITILGIAFNFYLTCNVCYFHLQLRYEMTYATELRILAQMERQEGYKPDMPTLVIGAFPNAYHSIIPQETIGVVQNLTGIKGNLVHHRLNYQGFFGYYLGKPLHWANAEEEKRIRAYLKDNPLPQWPMEGSVAIIGDVMVVNICSETSYRLGKSQYKEETGYANAASI